MENGFDFEAWTDDRGAEGFVMYVYNDGSFSGTWTETFNTLFRVGRRWPGALHQLPTVGSLGNISVRYVATEFTSNRGATYLTLYGWTRAQRPGGGDNDHLLIEWYIVDAWREYVPSAAEGSDYHHGTVTVNGATYDIVTAWRVNQPSLAGDTTFLQIFSVRRNSRDRPVPISGTIDVSAHFNAWETQIPAKTHGGQTFRFSGDVQLYEVSFTVEGFGGTPRSSGSGRVTQLCITYGSNRVCTNPSTCTHCP